MIVFAHSVVSSIISSITLNCVTRNERVEMCTLSLLDSYYLAKSNLVKFIEVILPWLTEPLKTHSLNKSLFTA